MERSREIKGHSGFRVRFWFTLIELLVSISILAAVSIVGYVSYAAHIKNSYNSTRIATIDALHVSLSDYLQLKKVLPQPTSNFISYDDRGTYMHSLSGAYGLSGHASDEFLPKGYANFSATDPESKQFYGYGKLVDNTAFDLASVLYDDDLGAYKTYLHGTYSKQRLSSLVRSYSSSDFVSQDSTENLPYNPYERKVTAYVSSHSGTVDLKDSTGNALSLTGELNVGDSVSVATGSTALLHISDGSELSLGSPTSQTRLVFSTMSYGDDTNLVSKVALFLKSGEAWTEAPHLRAEPDSASDFSIRTDTAVAAVRGTVFGISRNASGTTDIFLVSGKLQVSRLVLDVNGNVVSEQPFNTSNGFLSTATGWFVLDGTGSYMVVPDGGQSIRLNGIAPTGSSSPTSTGSFTPADAAIRLQHPPFSLGYRPLADKISFSGTVSDSAGTVHTANVSGVAVSTGILSVTFQNPGVDSYYLSFGTGKIDMDKPFPDTDPNPSYTGSLSSTGTVTITGAFAYIPDPNVARTYVLRVCFRGQCSAPDIKVLGGDMFSFQNFRLWGEKDQPTLAVAAQTISPTLSCSTADPSQSVFWTGACLAGTNSGLVAWAPYGMSTTTIYYNGAHSLEETENSLNDTSYRPYDMTYGKFVDNATWLETPPSYYSTLGVSKLVQTGSMYQWGTTKGIFLDNHNSADGTLNDYLRYNVASLNLTGSFAIEMSVRGGALKRTGSWYNLFWFSPSPYWTSTNYADFWLSINSSTLLWMYNRCTDAWSCYPSPPISSINLGTVTMDPNKFYTVRADIWGTSTHISITWNGLRLSGTIASTAAFASNPYLFIGSRPDRYNQWNDIIASVKIYKY